MKRLVILVEVALSVGLMACASAPPKPDTSELDGAPEWVTSGCAAFSGQKKTPICGVGMVTGHGTNFALSRDAAVGRARTDLARNLDLTVKALYEDYQQRVNSTEQDGANTDEEAIKQVSKQVVNMHLSGAQIAKVWKSKSLQTWAALVKLDTEGLREQLSQVKALDQKIRDGVLARAKEAQAELDKLTADPPTQ